MASISTDSKGRKRILFFHGGRRKCLRIPEYLNDFSETVHKWIEAVVVSSLYDFDVISLFEAFPLPIQKKLISLELIEGNARKRLETLRVELKDAARKANEMRRELDELKARIVASERDLVFFRTANGGEYPAIPTDRIPQHLIGDTAPMESGVYFIFEDGRTRYVGKSLCLANRLISHPEMTAHSEVCWIECDRAELDFCESYFIGILRPWANFRGCRGDANLMHRTVNPGPTEPESTCLTSG